MVHEWLQLQVRSIDGIGRWSHFASRARGGPGGGIIRVEMCCNICGAYLLCAAYYLFVHIFSGTDHCAHTDPPTGKRHSYHYPACTCTVIACFLLNMSNYNVYLQLNWIMYCIFLVISDICSYSGTEKAKMTTGPPQPKGMFCYCVHFSASLNCFWVQTHIADCNLKSQTVTWI